MHLETALSNPRRHCVARTARPEPVVPLVL